MATRQVVLGQPKNNVTVWKIKKLNSIQEVVGLLASLTQFTPIIFSRDYLNSYNLNAKTIFQNGTDINQTSPPMYDMCSSVAHPLQSSFISTY